MVQYALECQIIFNDNCENSVDKFEIDKFKELLNETYYEPFIDNCGIIDKLDNIQKILADGNLGCNFQAKLIVMECLFDTISILSGKLDIKYPKFKSDDNDRRAAIIKNVIDANIQNNITAEDISKLLYFSTKQINRILFQKYNQTINQYILTTRINMARKLLETTTYSIAQISDEVGFNNYQQMYRNFIQQLNISPVLYRKENFKHAENSSNTSKIRKHEKKLFNTNESIN